jgi:hypothetical protein
MLSMDSRFRGNDGYAAETKVNLLTDVKQGA